MNNKNPEIDAYLEGLDSWRDEMTRLRSIALGCQLREALKWGKPCYSYNDQNLVLLQGFKSFCALFFFNGALLKDPRGILQSQGKNTQAARRIPFTSVAQIVELEPTLEAYINEAIAVQKAGLQFRYREISEFEVPAELQQALDRDPALKAAFTALTPGRQRGYYLHIAAAKQSATRASRVDKCRDRIVAGKGLNDR